MLGSAERRRDTETGEPAAPHGSHSTHSQHGLTGSRGVAGERSRLSGGELAALQLMARGYSPDQIASLRRGGLVETLWDLQRVLGVLDATTMREAIVTARRRGLIA